MTNLTIEETTEGFLTQLRVYAARDVKSGRIPKENVLHAVEELLNHIAVTALFCGTNRPNIMRTWDDSLKTAMVDEIVKMINENNTDIYG